jgi:hypothetical protein
MKNSTFINEEDQRNEKTKTKVLALNKYMTKGPSGARCQELVCRLVAGSSLLLQLLPIGDVLLNMTAVHDRPVISSEGVPTQTKPQLSDSKKIWSWAADGAWHHDWLDDWLSVVTWLWRWFGGMRSKTIGVWEIRPWWWCGRRRGPHRFSRCAATPSLVVRLAPANKDRSRWKRKLKNLRR